MTRLPWYVLRLCMGAWRAVAGRGHSDDRAESSETVGVEGPVVPDGGVGLARFGKDEAVRLAEEDAVTVVVDGSKWPYAEKDVRNSYGTRR